MSEVGALAGRVFEQHLRPGAGTGGKELRERLADQLQSVLLGSVRIRAGVHDEPVESERFGAVEFLAKGGNRLRAQRRRGGREVNQVTVVRDDWTYAGFFDPLPKARNLRGWQLPGAPLAGRLREDLERLASRRLRAIDRARQAARDRHMST